MHISTVYSLIASKFSAIGDMVLLDIMEICGLPMSICEINKFYHVQLPEQLSGLYAAIAENTTCICQVFV